MDQNERDYLRRQVQELTRANRCWKTLALLVTTAFAVFLIVQAVAVLGHGVFSLSWMRQAELARMEAELAHRQAEQNYVQAMAVLERELATNSDDAPELLGFPRPEEVAPKDTSP